MKYTKGILFRDPRGELIKYNKEYIINRMNKIDIPIEWYKKHHFLRRGLLGQFELNIFKEIHRHKTECFIRIKAVKDFDNKVISPPCRTGYFFKKYMEYIADLCLEAKGNDDKDLPF